jgi:hypothetical protein
MRRRLAGVLAVSFILCAGLLVGSGATVSFAGESKTCAGPIVQAEAGPAAPLPEQDPVADGLARECERTDSQRLRWAALASLLALATGAYFFLGDKGSADKTASLVDGRV